MGTRTYRMTETGEQPIWASKKELVRMGQEWAEMHFRGSRAMGTEPLSVSNTTHDEACARRWEILTGKYPSWYVAGK
jgi:hypothetical protein